MPRQSNTKIPSAGFNQAAQRAASKGRQSVKKAFSAARSLIKQSFSQYAEAHLSKEHARMYKAGLSITATDNPLDLKVELKGIVPNALEKGYDSFDMKPGLLTGPAAKVTQEGTAFVDVPLSRQGIRSAVEKAQKESDNPSEIKKVLTHVASNRGSSRGSGKARGKAFRRVSEKSPPHSWIHPGFKGIHAAQALASDLYTSVMQLINSFLEKVK